MTRICISLLLAVFCGGGVAHAKDVRYQVVMLEPLSGAQSSSAYALNNKSEAVGYSNDGNGNVLAVYWGLDRVPVNLGTFGGPTSYACGINDGSYVVGYAGNSNYFHRAFLWDPISRVKHELGILGDSGSSCAFAINLKGQVAGYASAPSAPSQYWACIFQLGKPPAPIDQSGDCQAYGINDTGLVAGAYDGKPVVWDQGVRQELAPRVGQAQAVNNSGQVVGYCANLEQTHWRAFIWDKLKGYREITQNLQVIDSYANAINNKGQVVGRYVSLSGQIRGFIWEEGKGAEDISVWVNLPPDLPPGSVLLGFSDINDRGDILSAVNSGDISKMRACLLRPGTSMANITSLLLDD